MLLGAFDAVRTGGHSSKRSGLVLHFDNKNVFTRHIETFWPRKNGSLFFVTKRFQRDELPLRFFVSVLNHNQTWEF